MSAQPACEPPEHVVKQAKLEVASNAGDPPQQDGDDWVQAKIAEAAAADAGETPEADASENVLE